MSDETDHTLPGPAGLYFRTDDLTPGGWQQEHAARARLERWCAYCGQRSSYGFGETLHTDGVLTCSDPSCIAQGEAWMAETRKSEASTVQAPKAVPAPLAEPINPNAEPDLFGRAA